MGNLLTYEQRECGFEPKYRHIHSTEFKIQVHLVTCTAKRTDDVTFDVFSKLSTQATSTQRGKPVLQVRTKLESSPKLFTINSLFYIINFLAIIYSSILHYI